MTRKTILSALALGAVVSVTAAPAVSAQDETRSRHSYGLVGITAGQAVHLTVVNTLPPGPVRDELPPGPIRVRLALVGADGHVRAARRTEVAPGQSASLTLDFARLGVADARRASVRAVVDVIYPPGPTLPPGPSVDPSVSTLEIVDEETGRTSVLVHPAVIRGFNPQPDPPRE